MISHNFFRGRVLRIAVGITVLAILLIVGGAGAVPAEQWNKTFGGTGYGSAYDVEQTLDGGYVIIGQRGFTNPNNAAAWLIKTDTNGNETWNKTFNGTTNDSNWNTALSVLQTSSGDYIIAGATGSRVGNFDAWLIKTDEKGNELWNKTFGGKNTNDYASSARQTLDGGYIVAGTMNYDSQTNSSAWLIKTDANGIETWNKTYDKEKGVEVSSIRQTLDGGYIVAGRKYKDGTNSDAWIIKTDENGNELWNKTFVGANLSFASSVRQTLDGEYIVAGRKYKNGTNSDAWIIKTDENGNESWNATFGGLNDDGASDVQQTSDRGYIIAGGTKSFGAGQSDAWLIRINEDGNELWNKTIGGTGDDSAQSIKLTSDNSYIIAGATNSFGSGVSNAWLIKVSSEAGINGPIHNINKGTNYTIIQAAINDANAGDEIHVDSGTYYENVNVTKQLVLKGIDTGSEMPIVNGDGKTAIMISADGTTLEGFHFINSSVYGNAGIRINSSRNTIQNNKVSNNFGGIIIEPRNRDINENTVVNNIASNNFEGIGIYRNSNNTLNENILFSNEIGIGLHTSDNDISNNNKITNNTIGIAIEHGINNTFDKSEISNNGYGVLVVDSANIFTGNNISNSNVGIAINGSNNHIYHNNFVNNTQNANETGANIWDNGYPSGGNYWSDYTGADIKSGPNQDQPSSDGIGDTPYNISGGAEAQDRYPFMGQNGWLKLSLNVEKVYQYSDLWGKEIYDDALNWNPKPKNPTISRWGCALTSAVMVLKYHGVDTDPSVLNKWLNENRGYINGNINWYAVARYSKDKVSLNGNDIISGIKSGDWSNYKPIVDDALRNGHPVIAGVYMKIGKYAPDHWVVITGKTEKNGIETYTINDPASATRTTLLDYSDKVYALRIYKLTIESKTTNILQIVGKSPIELYITDPLGRHTGINSSSGSEVNEIPNSSYYYENIADEVSNDTSPDIKIFDALDSTEGLYNLSVIGTDTGNYSIDIDYYNEFGNRTDVDSFSGSTRPGNVQSFEIYIGTTSPLSVTNPNASPAVILNDNGRARPSGTNITLLNVTVTGNVSSVTINLSPIGGLTVVPMTRIQGTDIYTIATNATAGINMVNNLVINATDTSGNFNISVSIPLKVLLRGDFNGDGKIDLKDLLSLRRYLAGLEPSINPLVADIQPAEGDGKVDLKDLLLMRRYLAGQEPLI